MPMSREVWLHWRKQMSARLSAAMKRLPVAKKREVWRRYNELSRRRGHFFHVTWDAK